jgi:mannose-1-phosphate guanylyltransferase/phosphomannomutase
LSTIAGETGGVALPVTASDRTLQRCRERGVELMLTPLSPSGLLQAAASGGVSFASDRRGGYVFPAFLPAFDAAAALVRLVSLLEESSRSLAEIVAAVPAMPIVEGEVATPMEQKGLVMRTLMEQLAEEGAELVLVDGIKVVSDDGWALVVPDPTDPVTHVWAEGADLVSSEALVATYAERIARTLP